MWLNDVKVVLKDRVVPCARLRIEDGVFAEVIETYGGRTPRFTVIPGLIDLHTALQKRDAAPRSGARFPIEATLYDVDRRLAASGITLAHAAVEFAAERSDLARQEAALDTVEKIHRAAPSLSTEIRVHGRFSLDNPTTLPLIHHLLDGHRLHLVSVVDRFPNRSQPDSADLYWKSMAQWAAGSGSDPSNRQTASAIGQKPNGERTAERNWDEVRKVVIAASARGVPFGSHDDGTVQKVDLLADLGVRISGFPTTIEAAERAHARGMHVIMGAPNAYRGRSIRGNLSAQEAAHRGLLNIMASDHFPALLLQAAFKLVECKLLSLSESINLVSYHPAMAMGLHDRGHIATGTQADFVILEEGCLPRIRATYRRGRPIYSDGTFIPGLSSYAAVN